MIVTDITALIERLRDAFAEEPCIEELGEAADALEALYADNFALAAWQCVFHDGKTGIVCHENGGQYCAMERRAEKAEAALAAIAALSPVGAGMDSTEVQRTRQELRLNEQARAAAIRALAGDKP